ncbi:MAG: uroporphyrinogen-III C-methyltransferase [Nitrososphaerota archaeon]|nr:uroporphyrinogen-III C-methyltransferase [Nitrososphaerota archaeon]
MSQRGKVSLVGAGPGDPKLLTIGALEVLKRADVVMFDRLVSPEILRLVPTEARKVDVGKVPHCAEGGLTQEQINCMMIREAKAGRNVVRLKGGDPLLFSRGFEEIETLKAEDIDFEIVPGISSAIGVPSFVGIPLTHRRYSSSIAIVTGHEDKQKIRKSVNWKKLASSVDTIVVLMGVGRSQEIAELLIEGGLVNSTPIAVIERGTTLDQKIDYSTLDELAKGDLRSLMKSPSVIVIGKVVSLARKLFSSPTPLLRRAADAPNATKSEIASAPADQIPITWCLAAEFS